MKAPLLETIRKEDVPDSPEWFDVIIDAWNSFIEPIVQALSNRLTFVDNFDGQEYEDDINQTKLDNGYSFRVTMNAKPRGVLLLQIYKKSGSHEPITTAPYVDWLYQDGLITIYSISGIDATSTYRVRLQVI